MNENLKIDLIMRENQLLKLKNEELNATVDYVAIMADIDIPEEDGDEPQ